MPRKKLKSDDEVLLVTLNVLSRLGPSEFTLADVGREAGISPATLLQRFGSKRGLMLAAFKLGGKASKDIFAQSRKRYRSPLRALVEIFSSCVGFVQKPEELSNHLAFLQMDLADPEFHAVTLDYFRAMRSDIETLLREARAAGELLPCDTARLARTVEVIYNGALLTWALYREGTAGDWMRADLESVLAPYRRRKGR